MKIRQMLTEVLLEVTNQEIEAVATEAVEEAKSKLHVHVHVYVNLYSCVYFSSCYLESVSGAVSRHDVLCFPFQNPSWSFR